MDSHIFGLWITQTLQSLEVATCILLQREVEEPWVQEWLGKKVHKNCLVFSEVEDSYKKKNWKSEISSNLRCGPGISYHQ